ncbi:YcaO-like family protein [Kitasatospora sp. NBC_01287]|uniref:YcaO-like family protein n=1 Tax=Kitasatospora sp. NBC_01287 TaxID=2903573 RepID=UPI0022539542|nr:YcaO-like family protein [Kitasatospora sp. NBC_01287]MCX4750376.1 YcaO-like family protein [Kitasatospora sp. NBC_01287]
MPPPAARALPTSWPPQLFTPFPDEPELLFGRVAARSPLFDTTTSAGEDRVLIGSAAGGSAPEVALRARGELLERLGNVLAGRAAEAAPTLALAADHTGLRRHAVPALDPAHWSGPQSRETRQLWVTGASLLSGTELLVPAALAFLQHRPPVGCAAPARSGSTGLAAHPERSAAIDHAAWELLERDLLRRSWHDPARHPPNAAAVLGELPLPVRRVCELLGLEATALTLPAPGRRAVVVALCLHTPDRREQVFGARCGPAAVRAELLARAAHEALMVRWSMRTPAALRAYRRLAVTGAPSSAVEHALWTYHGGQDALAHWLRSGPPTTPPRPRSPAATTPAPTEPLDPVRLLSEHTGQDVIAVDTTPAQLRSEGLSVVRLLAPGARPLPAASAPGVPPHPFG